MIVSGPNIIHDGLVLYLDVGNIDSYPGSGSMLYDLSGNNKHHTIIDAPTYNNINPKNFTLNGSTQGYQCLSGITTSTTCTVVVYTKTSDTKYLWVCQTNGNYYLSADSGYGYYSDGCGTSINNYVDTILSYFQPHDNVWHMLEAKSVDFSSWVQFDWFLYPYGDFEFRLSGDSSIIMVYDRNLTAAESLQNYRALKGRYI